MPPAEDTLGKDSELSSLMVAVVLNALVALVVVVAIGLHLLDRYRQEVRHVRDMADHAAIEQSVSLGDQLLNIEYVLGQLSVRLNEDTVLNRLGDDALHRSLNQFKGLLPGAHDLLLVRPNGQVLAASQPLAKATPLERYCPVLAQQAPALRHAALWRFPDQGVLARCPPPGTLVLAHRPLLLQDQSEVWLLLEPGRFERELMSSLKADLPSSQYRLLKRLDDRTVVLAERGLDTPDEVPAFGFGQPDLSTERQFMGWTDPATGSTMAGVLRQVPGTPLFIQVAYPLHATLRPLFHSYLMVWLVGGAAFLLLWTAVAWQTLKLMRRYHRALRRNEERFNRSLGYAATGVWEWEAAADVLSW